MLTEAFGEFYFDDEDENGEEDTSKQIKQNNNEQIKNDIANYEPMQHSSKWFFDDKLASKHNNEREVTYFKAVSAYQERDFDTSLKYYKEWLRMGDHKSSHRSAIVDSIIRSALKTNSVEMSAIVSFLHDDLLPLVSSFGEQLQYWSLSLEVYKKLTGYHYEYIRNAILLCASVDIAEHWLLLADADLNAVQISECSNHFRIGCLCRALNLLESQTATSRGFMRGISEHKFISLNDKLKHEFSENEINDAKRQMCLKTIKIVIGVDETYDEFAPPHDCKMKTQFKNLQQQKMIIKNFTQIFHWLFENCSPHSLITLYDF